MRFAPQPRPLFEHQDFQTCSKHVDLFSILSSNCASRHSPAQFLTSSTSKSAPNLRCFWPPNVLCDPAPRNRSCLTRPNGSAPAALARPLFDPPEPQNIGKTQFFATCLPFRALWSSFCWLSLLWLFLFWLWLFSRLLRHLPVSQKFDF